MFYLIIAKSNNNIRREILGWVKQIRHNHYIPTIWVSRCKPNTCPLHHVVGDNPPYMLS